MYPLTNHLSCLFLNITTAPTNDAFAALPEGTVESLLLPENIDALTGILAYHVVAAEAPSTSLVNGDVETLNGASVTVNVDDGVKINDSNVIIPDIDACNGIIHVIDAVLLPPNPTSNPTNSPTLFISNDSLTDDELDFLEPTKFPTESPSLSPVITNAPTRRPSSSPTKSPSLPPTKKPTTSDIPPSSPTIGPTDDFTEGPTQRLDSFLPSKPTSSSAKNSTVYLGQLCILSALFVTAGLYLSLY